MIPRDSEIAAPAFSSPDRAPRHPGILSPLA
jgi:hypothetical protein